MDELVDRQDVYGYDALAWALLANDRADAGPGARWRSCTDASPRPRPPARIPGHPRAAGGRARPPARQLHDQPLRGAPDRTRPGHPRPRHRPGRDPGVPGAPGARRERGRRGLGWRARSWSRSVLRCAGRRPAPRHRWLAHGADADGRGHRAPARRRRPVDAPPGVRLRGRPREAGCVGHARRIRRHLVRRAARLARDRRRRFGRGGHAGRGRAARQQHLGPAPGLPG